MLLRLLAGSILLLPLTAYAETTWQRNASWLE